MNIVLAVCMLVGCDVSVKAATVSLCPFRFLAICECSPVFMVLINGR